MSGPVSATSYGHDALGRVDIETTPSGATHYTYDPAGRVQEITDPDGHTVRYEYDGANNLIAIQPESSGAQVIQYDSNERPSSFYNPGGLVEYEYDTESNVIGTTAYGKDYGYTYDSRGRIKTQTLPDGSTSSYDYTSAGFVSKVTHGNGDETRYEYDNNERLKTVSSDSGYQRLYAYFSSGYLGSEFVGSTVTGPSPKAYSFHPDGNLTNFYSDDQGFIDQHYYQYGGVHYALLFVRPRTTANVNDIPLAFRNLVLACMNPDACSDPDVAAAMRKFQVIDPVYDQSTYTDIENRVAQVLWLFAPVRYLNNMSPTSGRLLSTQDRIEGTTSTFGYDASGNVIDRSVTNTVGGAAVAHHSFTFDSRDRMSRYRDHAVGDPTEYYYDDQGRLTTIAGLSDSAELRYDLDGRLVQENGAHGELTYAYNPLGLESVSIAPDGEPAERYYYEFNTRGDVIHMVDEDGQIVVTYHYDAWGNQRTEGDADLIAFNRFTYRGQSGTIYVRPMGMYYMGVRWYDPTQQRFMSQDPAGTDPTKNANTYAYAYNNPINYLDETGLTARPVRTLNATKPAPIAAPPAVMPMIPVPTVVAEAPRDPAVPRPSGQYAGPGGDYGGVVDEPGGSPGAVTREASAKCALVHTQVQGGPQVFGMKLTHAAACPSLLTPLVVTGSVRIAKFSTVRSTTPLGSSLKTWVFTILPGPDRTDEKTFDYGPFYNTGCFGFTVATTPGVATAVVAGKPELWTYEGYRASSRLRLCRYSDGSARWIRPTGM